MGLLLVYAQRGAGPCEWRGRTRILDSRTDQELIAAANAGDERAFEALYRRHRDWVLRVAHRFTGNRDDALDVLQDVFIYLLGKFPGFRLTARLTTFLYPATRNAALQRRRKASRFVDAGDDVFPEPVSHEETPSARDDLRVALRRLTAPQRETLLMRYVDGLTLEEIAAALQTPIGTVKSRLHAALETLRNDPAATRYFLDE